MNVIREKRETLGRALQNASTRLYEAAAQSAAGPQASGDGAGASAGDEGDVVEAEILDEETGS
jgi:hypothetical protein